MSALSLEKRSFQRRIKYRRDILWERTNLNYAVFGNIASLNQTKISEIKKVISDAFGEWQHNSCFRFKDVTPSSLADIKIIFTNDRPKIKEQSNSIISNFSHNTQCEFRIKGKIVYNMKVIISNK